MAFLFSRRQSGGDYTPFEIDDQVFGIDTGWAAFFRGEGLPLPADKVKSAKQIKQTSARIPDILTLGIHHCCNQRWKDFLEEWEPGLHFFKAVEVKRKNGERMGDYYLWTPGQDIDCILTDGLAKFWETSGANNDPELSFLEAVRQAHYHYKYPDRGDGTTIQISKPAVAGRHLWMGGYLALLGRGTSLIFMSDEMHAAYRKEKFRYLQPECSAAELQQDWVAQEQMGPLLAAWQIREGNIRRCWPKTPPRHGKAS